MKKTILLLSLGVALSLLTQSCSYQWRDAEAGIDDQALLKLIDDIGNSFSTSSTGTGNISAFVSMAHDPNTSVFFAEGWSDGSGSMGTPASVLAFEDFTFMGQPNTTYLDINDGRVIFLDQINESGVRKNALLIDYYLKGQKTAVTKVFISQDGAATMNKNEFEVLVDDGSGTQLILRTSDFDEGSEDLNRTIQLLAWDFTSSDHQENFLGKIPTLVGFGYSSR